MINTTDGTAMYEAAFAMVWVTDDSDAMNVNEAQAYASCTSCTAVAVAYQVVFVIDNDEADDNVVAPQNLAGALNYECVNCLTYALARQLFITLDEPLSDSAMRELDGVWGQMATFEREIEAGRLGRDEIEARLEGYTQQIVAIVKVDQPEAVASATGTSTAPTTTTTSVATTTSSAPTSSSAPTTDPSETASTAPATEATTVEAAATTATPTNTSATATPETSAVSEPSATNAPTAENTASDSDSEASSADSGATSP